MKWSRFMVAAALCWTPTCMVLAGSVDISQSELTEPRSLTVVPAVVSTNGLPEDNHRLLLAAKESEEGATKRSKKKQSKEKRSKKRASFDFPHGTVLGGYASFLGAIGLPPSTLWKVLQQSNFLLEAIARSEALYTGQKKALVWNLLKLRPGRTQKSVIDGLEKVLGELTSTEQFEAMLVMLNEPNIKSALLQLPIDEVYQSNAPLDPNKLSVFGMEQPDGQDYLAAMDSRAGLPGATSGDGGSRSGSGGGAGKRKQSNKGSGASLKDMIDCLDVLHPQGGQTIGGDGTGPDPNPIGTTVNPDGGWTSGSKGQPKKKTQTKGIGFGEAGQCYGLDLSKLSDWASDEDKSNKENTEANKENQKGEKDEVVTQPSHYSWSVEYEYKYKGELNTGRETFEGIVVWSTDEKTWNLAAEFQAEMSFKGETEGYTEELTITGTQDEIKQEVAERFLNSLADALSRNEGKITNVSHNKLYDPDALDQEPCDNTDYEAFAACIGGSGAAPEDCKGKGKYQSGGIAMPNGQWLGCSPNKAMAIGLLPIHKLWDPSPLEKIVQLRLEMLSQPGAMLPVQSQKLIDKVESQKGQESKD